MLGGVDVRDILGFNRDTFVANLRRWVREGEGLWIVRHGEAPIQLEWVFQGTCAQSFASISEAARLAPQVEGFIFPSKDSYKAAKQTLCRRDVCNDPQLEGHLFRETRGAVALIDQTALPPKSIGGKFPSLISESGLYKIITRALTIDGKPWFAVTDIGAALGMNERGTSCHVRATCDRAEVVMLSKAETPHEIRGMFRARSGRITLVNESGFYRFTLRAQSSRPNAKAFQDWVTKEVLPRIRRDGDYHIPLDAPLSLPNTQS